MQYAVLLILAQFGRSSAAGSMPCYQTNSEDVLLSQKKIKSELLAALDLAFVVVCDPVTILSRPSCLA